MKWVLCVQWLRLAVTGLGLGLQSLHSLCQLHTNGLLKLIEGPFGLHSLHSYTIGLSRPIRWVKIASNSILQFRLRFGLLIVSRIVFYAPPGYVELYTYSFSLANLRLPLTKFFCEVLEYFQWLTFAKRSEKHIPNLLPKVITHIEGWHKRFFYVRDSIIPAKYPQLLSEQNKLDLKSFKDKLPSNIKENPMFQHLSRYPTSVRVFPDPILFLAGLKPSWEHEMAFRNFIYTKDDDDLAFLPNEPSPRFGIGSPSASVNTKPPKDVEEPEVQPAEVTADLGESPKADVFIVHPGSVVVRIKERKCKTRGGSLRPPVKRRLASGSLSSYVMCAKTSASKDDALFLSISDDDEGKFLVIEKMSGEADVIKARERSHEEECERLRVKCEAAMVVFYQNPAVLALREKISSLIADVKEQKDKARLEAVEASLHREVEELKQDRRDVVSKVIPYIAMELVHSDELGRLVGKLVSSAITFGCCRAYEQVASIKEPFDLLKAKGYRSSY
ncbi:hypothetical protein Tco_0046088 [Tanacetum coccineum]